MRALPLPPDFVAYEPRLPAPVAWTGRFYRARGRTDVQISLYYRGWALLPEEARAFRAELGRPPRSLSRDEVIERLSAVVEQQAVRDHFHLEVARTEDLAGRTVLRIEGRRFATREYQLSIYAPVDRAASQVQQIEFRVPAGEIDRWREAIDHGVAGIEWADPPAPDLVLRPETLPGRASLTITLPGEARMTLPAGWQELPRAEAPLGRAFHAPGEDEVRLVVVERTATVPEALARLRAACVGTEPAARLADLFGEGAGPPEQTVLGARCAIAAERDAGGRRERILFAPLDAAPGLVEVRYVAPAALFAAHQRDIGIALRRVEWP